MQGQDGLLGCNPRLHSNSTCTHSVALRPDHCGVGLDPFSGPPRREAEPPLTASGSAWISVMLGKSLTFSGVGTQIQSGSAIVRSAIHTPPRLSSEKRPASGARQGTAAGVGMGCHLGLAAEMHGRGWSWRRLLRLQKRHDAALAGHASGARLLTPGGHPPGLPPSEMFCGKGKKRRGGEVLTAAEGARARVAV